MNNSVGIGRPTQSKIAASTSAINQSRKSSAAIYNMFDPKQVQTFKEAFSMIDQDSDGWITEADLKTMLTSLGQAPTPKILNSLLSSRPGTKAGTIKVDSLEYNQGLNFTTFLTMMSEKLLELDPEFELLEAFQCFDEDNNGSISGKEIRHWLSSAGDKMSNEEIDKLLSPPYADRHGNTFNYRDFISALRVSEAPPVTMKE